MTTPAPRAIAVLSDIHGNLEALESVLEDLETQKVDAVFSLGDDIGYGADSESVVRRLSEIGATSVLGNHEMAAREPRALKWFREDSRKALSRAIASLSPDSMRRIGSLQTGLSMFDCRFVHGFPPDSVRIYLFQVGDAQFLEAFDAMAESICFVGHTHLLRMASPEDDGIRFRDLEEGEYSLDPKRKTIVNAGSVGQPRDGDPRAKYLVWEPSARLLRVRFVPYDAESAAKKILRAGVPARYARILMGNAPT